MTGATAQLGSLAEALQRAADPEAFDRWLRQVRSAGCCRKPVLLRGRATAVDLRTGELLRDFDTAAEPDGVVLKACGNRRATVCPTCSVTYRGDAYQLIHAGLAGGKGVPSSVSAHPRVFVTLTAPSFGPVHSRREDGGRVRRCTTKRPGRCAHGVVRECRQRHGADDYLVGQPICAPCFDYTGAVLWNARAGELWRRTTIRIRRGLARAVGVTVTALAKLVRVSFSKVVEYQARGLVHLHAIVRLDGAADDVTPPPREYTVKLLAEVIRDAVPAVRAPLPAAPDTEKTLIRWGDQSDVRPIPSASADGVRGEAAVARYVAKYATKSSDPLGALDHRIRSADEIDLLQVNEHLRTLVATAWQLGREPLYKPLRLRQWAHTLGYRGHWTTKSRSYSTTLTALRQARTSHARAGSAAGPGDDHGEWVGSFQYAGRGYRTTGDAWLAETAAGVRGQGRRTAALERAINAPTDR